ncbi:MAG: outer membrane beta-barrel protein, partial [Halioglobus sp.]
RVLVRAGYMERAYQNFKNFTRPRDRDETTLGSTFFYPVAPKTSLLADYTFKHIHYPNPFAEAPPLDSDENSLLLGVKWEITPNLASTAKAGYVDKRFDDPERKDWDGLGWSVELLMKPREQDTISVLSSRAPEETTLQGDFIKRTGVSATWTHNWSDRVFTELGTLYSRDIYEQSINDRKDDTYNVSFRVGYQFRRWASFYTGYSYDDRNSNVDNLSYTDNVFNIGVEVSL